MPSPDKQRFNSTALFFVTAWGTALLIGPGCANAPPPSTSSGMGIHLQALSSCGESNPRSPFADVKVVELVVHDDAGKELMRSKRQYSGQKQLSFAEVPAGPGRTITILGYPPAGPASWFARKRGIKVVKNAQTTLDLTLMKLGGYTCVSKSGGSIPNVVFGDLTQIDNGRVLVTGAPWAG